MPAELGSGLGGVGGLVEEQHFGEVVAEAVPGFFVGAGDGPRGANSDGGGLGQFSHGGVQAVADDVVATGASASSARRKNTAMSATWTWTSAVVRCRA